MRAPVLDDLRHAAASNGPMDGWPRHTTSVREADRLHDVLGAQLVHGGCSRSPVGDQ
jgi:hypothetical protein